MGRESRHLGEAVDSELRAAPVRLVGECLDTIDTLIGVEPQVKVDLLEFGLEVQVKEEPADVDKGANSGAQPFVFESLVPRHNGYGD